ncbi:hypothetical protein CRENBAI_007352 [Crenichthys baileyi]|uniref:Uncharacterized protein n=1 Tax=Crenichthys baileyi TaxID=28760 RepID=A0AAV9R2W8_9TELE
MSLLDHLFAEYWTIYTLLDTTRPSDIIGHFVSSIVRHYKSQWALRLVGDVPSRTSQESTADGQIIFFPFAKEAKGQRLTALPEVNRGRTLTSNFPPPPLRLTFAALKDACTK